jgi:hypothetical protein
MLFGKKKELKKKDEPLYFFAATSGGYTTRSSVYGESDVANSALSRNPDWKLYRIVCVEEYKIDVTIISKIEKKEV